MATERPKRASVALQIDRKLKNIAIAWLRHFCANPHQGDRIWANI